MGIIYFTTENDEVIASALTGIYFGYAALLVIVSYIVSRKMKNIFFQIVKDETWFLKISERNVGESTNRRDQSNFSKLMKSTSARFFSTTDHLENQNDYFWGSNPAHVVTIAQVGQFG